MICSHLCLERQFLYLQLTLQFSSVAQSCLTLCDPMNRSTPGLPVHHQLLEFTQTHVHRVSEVTLSGTHTHTPQMHVYNTPPYFEEAVSSTQNAQRSVCSQRLLPSFPIPSLTIYLVIQPRWLHTDCFCFHKSLTIHILAKDVEKLMWWSFGSFAACWPNWHYRMLKYFEGFFFEVKFSFSFYFLSFSPLFTISSIIFLAYR